MNPVIIGDATLYHGDALRVLSELPDAVADCMITDPPYSSGGMLRGDRLQDVHTKYVQTDSVSGHQLLGFTGDNRDQFGYLLWIAVWLNESRRVLKPGAVVAIFTDWRQLPITCSALQAGGLVWRGIVPWHKPGARPIQGRWANSCEYLVWGTNGPRELAGGPLPGMFTANAPRGEDRDHITQKPVGVLEHLAAIIKPGETLLDPFMGSGTAGVACAYIGRKFIGSELERWIFDAACERIDNAYRQQRLFA